MGKRRAGLLLPGLLGLLLTVGVQGCQSTTGKTAGETISDASITTAVQAKLTRDRVANFVRVDVDTDRGIVSLSGVVPSADQKLRAEELTREVKGVVRVNNNIQVQNQSATGRMNE